jgi:hypothetical protein
MVTQNSTTGRLVTRGFSGTHIEEGEPLQVTVLDTLHLHSLLHAHTHFISSAVPTSYVPSNTKRMWRGELDFANWVIMTVVSITPYRPTSLTDNSSEGRQIPTENNEDSCHWSFESTILDLDPPTWRELLGHHHPGRLIPYPQKVLTNKGCFILCIWGRPHIVAQAYLKLQIHMSQPQLLGLQKSTTTPRIKIARINQ